MIDITDLFRPPNRINTDHVADTTTEVLPSRGGGAMVQMRDYLIGAKVVDFWCDATVQLIVFDNGATLRFSGAWMELEKGK